MHRALNARSCEHIWMEELAEFEKGFLHDLEIRDAKSQDKPIKTSLKPKKKYIKKQ